MKQKLEGLEFVRAAACLGILLYHIRVTHTGYFAVAVFFALSGFLMTYNALGREETEPPTLKGSIAFSLRRTKKLYGLYLLTLIFPLLEQLYGVMTGLGEVNGLLVMRITVNIFLLQSLIPDVNTGFFMNGVAWYMSTSIFLYIAFPYILRRLRCWSKTKARRTIIVTFLLQSIGGYFINELAVKLLPAGYIKSAGFTQWLAYISPFSRIADFIIACNLGYLFRNREKTDRSVKAATVYECAAIILAIAAELFFEKNIVPEYLCYSSIFIPAASLLIWEFARGEGYVSRIMNNAAVHFISDISPYLFLIHPIVILSLAIVIDRIPVSFAVQRCIYVTVIPLVAVLCSVAYRALEKKIKSRKTA